jgi:hypothetical protein
MYMFGNLEPWTSIQYNFTEVGPWTVANAFFAATFHDNVCHQFSYLGSNTLMCCITLQKELIDLALKGLAKILTATFPHKR